MGCRSWMGCTVTLLDGRFAPQVRKWAESMRLQVAEDDSNRLSFLMAYDEAGWFNEDSVLELLRRDLLDVPAPLGAWSASVRYEFHDEPFLDGSIVEFSVTDGKIADYKESRIEMVVCEPPVKFDLMEGKSR